MMSHGRHCICTECQRDALEAFERQRPRAPVTTKLVPFLNNSASTGREYGADKTGEPHIPASPATGDAPLERPGAAATASGVDLTPGGGAISLMDEVARTSREMLKRRAAAEAKDMAHPNYRAKWERESLIAACQAVEAGEDIKHAAERIHRRYHRVVSVEQLERGMRLGADWKARRGER